MSALVAENVFVDFGLKEVLKGVAIRADVHKITGLLGRNGSGKSTLLKVMFGIQQAADAMVTLEGKKLYHAYQVNSVVNYLPQYPFLPRYRKLKKIVADYEVSLEEILFYFPSLEDDIDKCPDELSGGTERLWAAIILLMADTQFTLLDEPFSHIMPLHVEHLKELIQQQKMKKGIILTDHMYRHLLSVSDTLYLMKDGKSIYIKDPAELVLHGYVRTLDNNSPNHNQ